MKEHWDAGPVQVGFSSGHLNISFQSGAESDDLGSSLAVQILGLPGPKNLSENLGKGCACVCRALQTFRNTAAQSLGQTRHSYNGCGVLGSPGTLKAPALPVCTVVKCSDPKQEAFPPDTSRVVSFPAPLLRLSNTNHPESAQTLKQGAQSHNFRHSSQVPRGSPHSPPDV